jgi:cell wall-associated NlpC family hydrolase
MVLLGVLWLLVATAGADVPDYAVYVIQQPKTLAAVAAETHVSVAYLAGFNRMGVNDALAPGQVVLIPVSADTGVSSVGGPGQTVPPPPPPPPPDKTGRAGPRIPEKTPPPPKTPLGPNEIEGVVGIVTPERAQITSRAGGGDVLFADATRGTQLLVIGHNGEYYAVLMEDTTPGWIAKGDLALTTNTMRVQKPKPPQGHPEIIDTAKTYLGVPYKYGGALPDTVDCSLLVQTVFARHGVKLPRTAAEQSLVGGAVAMQDLLPGDRLSFYDRDGKRIGHTGIYMGENQFIHASSGRGMVAINTMDDKVYTDRTYRQILASAHRDTF